MCYVLLHVCTASRLQNSSSGSRHPIDNEFVSSGSRHPIDNDAHEHAHYLLHHSNHGDAQDEYHSHEHHQINRDNTLSGLCHGVCQVCVTVCVRSVSRCV